MRYPMFSGTPLFKKTSLTLRSLALTHAAAIMSSMSPMTVCGFSLATKSGSAIVISPEGLCSSGMTLAVDASRATNC